MGARSNDLIFLETNSEENNCARLQSPAQINCSNVKHVRTSYVEHHYDLIFFLSKTIGHSEYPVRLGLFWRFPGSRLISSHLLLDNNVRRCYGRGGGGGSGLVNLIMMMMMPIPLPNRGDKKSSRGAPEGARSGGGNPRHKDPPPPWKPPWGPVGTSGGSGVAPGGLMGGSRGDLGV